MVFHDPRPIWLWDDLSKDGCAYTFASPAGHSIDTSMFAAIILLDHFFSSEWSRKKFPELCKKTTSTNPILFGVCTAFFFILWAVVGFARLVVGRHKINQLILGTLIGAWAGCFMHYNIRDHMFLHISQLTWSGSKVTSE